MWKGKYWGERNSSQIFPLDSFIIQIIEVITVQLPKKKKLFLACCMPGPLPDAKDKKWARLAAPGQLGQIDDTDEEIM